MQAKQVQTLSECRAVTMEPQQSDRLAACPGAGISSVPSGHPFAISERQRQSGWISIVGLATVAKGHRPAAEDSRKTRVTGLTNPSHVQVTHFGAIAGPGLPDSLASRRQRVSILCHAGSCFD
jgi:hypothetical protein